MISQVSNLYPHVGNIQIKVKAKKDIENIFRVKMTARFIAINEMY